MSDTLRTDTLLIIHDMDPEPKVLINHARALERALNNADAKIKRLEEAGDRMRLYCADLDDCFAWDKARKDNP